MAPADEMQTAMVNRSIRTIKAELEYLCDASVITPQTLNDLLQRIPQQTALRAPLSVGALPSAIPSVAPTPISPPPMQNLNLNHTNNSNNGFYGNEKDNNHFSPPPGPGPQSPPAYGAAPPPAAQWPPLCQATALYAYTSSDAGDLELQPNDHVTVTEYMNAEWWKGRSSRTGHEGIFPRSYVKVIEDKGPDPGASTANNYGNMPLQTSGMGNGQGRIPGKGEEMGKKFGKKLGNAAIFGAGATIGSNIVNTIL